MRLFIQLSDGQPIGHPITESNMRYSFPNVNLENLPSDFCSFERVPKPSIGIYEVYDGLRYEMIDGVVKDVHIVRPMTDEERADKIEKSKQVKPFNSWIFNEETCAYDAPIPKPEGSERYKWNEDNQSWYVYNP
jgi:hypothetical protein